MFSVPKYPGSYLQHIIFLNLNLPHKLVLNLYNKGTVIWTEIKS